MTPRKKKLQKEDVIGRNIQMVYCSKWDFDTDGYGSCSTYVETDSGIIIPLEYLNLDEDDALYGVSMNKKNLLPLPDDLKNLCIGKMIIDVLLSELWGAFGLLLSNGYILTIDECGIKQVGPVLLDTRTKDWRVSEYNSFPFESG